jgi:succinate dehydrogenase/fumarate reductase flavoprotein subunit
MKGCFKFLILAIVLLCVLSFGRYYLLTPEQRAAEMQAFKAQMAAEEKQAAAETETSKAERERIEALKPEFILWLQKNAGVETGRFRPGVTHDVLEVKYNKAWTSKDEARVKAEALAHAWRLRSGLDYAECAIYWGNEIYATGSDR